jgi:NhaP-type Na+/H+ or K+/H+ antiporter
MTPLSFEWLWNVEYFIFMGFLYLALAIIACGLVVAYVKTWVQIHQEDKSEVSQPKISSRSKYSEY